MKSATLIHLLTAVAFLCVSIPESQSGPPQVPGYRGPSHAQNPPDARHHYTPTPRGPSSNARPNPGPVVVHQPGPPPHGPHGPGFYPPPPPPLRIPIYWYPPVVVSYPISYPVSVPVYTETYYQDNSPSDSTSSMKQIGIFKAFVYKAPDSDEVQQNGVAIFYINDQNLLGGYFYIKADQKPLSIQGTTDPQSGDVEFRVVGMAGTYFTKLNHLVARDKVFLTYEKENKEGKTEVSEVGYLSRVQEKL